MTIWGAGTAVAAGRLISRRRSPARQGPARIS